MATNRNLRAALLDRLKVTPQRLSQRVKQVKLERGPMSTEDATYVIAHEQAMDLTKYLDPLTVDRVRGLVARAAQETGPASAKKRYARRPGSPVVRIEPDVPEVDALLSTTLAGDARRMAAIYPKYYVLENSIRVVIMRVLETKYGNRWWRTRVPQPVQDRVTGRKQQESNRPWHGKRGQHEIFYSDFGDLSKIITRNWDEFRTFFPSQAWISQRLEDLEHPRNVMAHHNALSPEDEQRINLYFSDWASLVQSRRDQIPP